MKDEWKSKHFELKKVKDGIYAAISKPEGGAVGNAGFVDLGDQLIVFDTFNTQQASKDLRDIAENITNQKVTFVINSHWHGDHIRGNQTYKDIPILSSESTLSRMKKEHPIRIQKQKDDIQGLTQYIESLSKQVTVSRDSKLQEKISFLRELKYSLSTLELILPNETYIKKGELKGKKRNAEWFTMGGGHSSCDTMLYIPEEKVIFMGDLVFVQCHPTFFDESNPKKWMEILQKVKDLDIEMIIPGHGPIGRKEDIDKMIDYIMHLLSIKDEENVAIPSIFKDWTSPEIYLENIKRVLR